MQNTSGLISGSVEFPLRANFFFGFVVFSLSWFEIYESRTELISPVEMFKWSSPLCFEVSIEATADCSILWPQSEQRFTLRVEETKEIYKSSPSDCNFRRNSAQFRRAIVNTSAKEREMIPIGFWDRIVQSYGIPTLNDDENRINCQSS